MRLPYRIPSYRYLYYRNCISLENINFLRQSASFFLFVLSIITFEFLRIIAYSLIRLISYAITHIKYINFSLFLLYPYYRNSSTVSTDLFQVLTTVSSSLWAIVGKTELGTSPIKVLASPSLIINITKRSELPLFSLLLNRASVRFDFNVKPILSSSPCFNMSLRIKDRRDSLRNLLACLPSRVLRMPSVFHDSDSTRSVEQRRRRRSFLFVPSTHGRRARETGTCLNRNLLQVLPENASVDCVSFLSRLD